MSLVPIVQISLLVIVISLFWNLVKTHKIGVVHLDEAKNLKEYKKLREKIQKKRLPEKPTPHVSEP